MNSHSLNYRIEQSKFNPVKLGKWFGLAAAVLVIASIFILIFAGFNLGLDFTGGTVMKIEIGAELEQSGKYAEITGKIEQVLNNNGLRIAQSQMQGSGAEASVLIQYQDLSGYTDAQMNELNVTIQTEISSAFGGVYDVMPADRKGPTAAGELLLNAFYALLVSMILITIYIAVRFEFFSGLAAIVAQIHDVLLVCAFVLIFRIEINSAFIAALITVMGYSINDTIIVFDRIRHNRKLDSLAKLSSTEIVNLSVKQTLVRSINTSLTTLMAIIMLTIVGVPSIREFALPLAVGLVVGTYSSFFIAAPLWVRMVDSPRGQAYFEKKAGRKKEASAAKAQTGVKDAEFSKAD